MKHRPDSPAPENDLLGSRGEPLRVGQSERIRGRADLSLDASGSITYISAAARRLLGYRENRDPESLFFAHIHGRNLLPVMRDIASMVSGGKKAARWIVRMRTASGGWIWTRMIADRLRTPHETTILISLTRVDA